MMDKAWRRPFVWAGDTKRHEFLYDVQAIFKIGTALAAALTLLSVFNSWPGAPLFAVLFLVSWLLWMGGMVLERRARRGLRGPTTEGEWLRERETAEAGADVETQRAAERRATRAGVTLAIEILVALALLAVVAAAVLFDARTFVSGAVVVFACLVLFNAPCWAAAVHERLSVERERAGRDPGAGGCDAERP
jgi:hypothetical protein